MRTKIDCCGHCEDERTSHCHATCEEYKRQKAELDADKAKARLKREAEVYSQMSVANAQDGMTKDKKRKRGLRSHSGEY